MKKLLLCATVFGLVVFARTDSRACSQPVWDVGEPNQDLGYDAIESPADPTVSSTQMYDHTFDSSGALGCGGSTSCDGVRTKLTFLRIQPSADVDRIRIEYEDGLVTHADFSEEGDLVRAEMNYDTTVPYDVTVSFYDADGYESGRVTVTVTETTESFSASAPIKQVGFLFAVLLTGVVLYRRRGQGPTNIPHDA